MPVTDIRPFAYFLAGGADKPPPRQPARKKTVAETEAERKRQDASAHLVALSRKSPRGQAYAQKADSVRSMLGEMKDTDDWKRRRAIVQTLKSKGWIDE